MVGRHGTLRDTWHAESVWDLHRGIPGYPDTWGPAAAAMACLGSSLWVGIVGSQVGCGVVGSTTYLSQGYSVAAVTLRRAECDNPQTVVRHRGGIASGRMACRGIQSIMLG